MIQYGDIKEIDLKLLDLFIREYEQLKIEARDAIAESRLIERNATIASAAVWVWFISQPPGLKLLAMLKFIPIVLCVFGLLRSYALHVRLRRISEYISDSEVKFGNKDIIGWESKLNEQPWVLTATSGIFWLTIIIANTGAAILIS